MSTPNPLSDTHSTPPPSVSQKTIPIAGIHTTIYGLEELPSTCTSVTCLWLLHPRLGDVSRMTPIARSVLQAYSSSHSSESKNSTKGLITVAFDQRNHGTRLINDTANQAWREGNETHAQDMFSVYHGTATDTSLLIDHLGSFVFHEHEGKPKITIDRHFVLGVSLGGHAAWQLLFSEPRIEAAVVIIGCPDYMRVMKDRARLSKRKSYTRANSNGDDFFGSADFPDALVATCKRYDPKALFFGTSEISSSSTVGEKTARSTLLKNRVQGKKVLICSGGADKLVPYACSKPFLEWFKGATVDQGDGEGSELSLYIEDNVYPGIGHAFSPDMARDSVRFLCNLMEGVDPATRKQESNL